METRTITIKSFEKTNGTKKDQTEWHRISIKATDGKFYSSFKPIAEAALVPGTQLEVKVIQSPIKENTFDIEKVVGFIPPNANPNGLNNFIAGLFIGVIIGVDMWLIAYLVKQVN